MVLNIRFQFHGIMLLTFGNRCNHMGTAFSATTNIYTSELKGSQNEPNTLYVSKIQSETLHKPADLNSYAYFLLGFVKLKTLEEAKPLHSYITKTGIDPHISFWNTLLNVYAKNRELMDAREVFDRMPERNSVSWNAMIAGYVQHGHYENALRLLPQMRGAGVKPNEFTFASVLRACATLSALEEGKQVHAIIKKIGLESDAFGGSALVDMYAKCRQQEDAHKLFDRLPERSVVSWNALIAGYAQSGHGEEALKLFCTMQQVGEKPTQFTFSSVLMACAIIATLEEGKQVHTAVIKTGVQANVFVGSALIDMYAKCSNVEDARAVFDGMPDRNVVSWTTMIAGYAQHQCIEEVLQLLKQMLLVCTSINQFTLNTVLGAFARPEDLEQGNPVHALVIKTGFESYACVGVALVTMYAKCGNIDSFRKVYEKMPEQNVVSWNAMISGYAQHGYSEEALQHFAQMHRALMMPDLFTCASILRACATLAILEQGKQVHAHIIKTGNDLDVSVQNALVTMYAKSGSIEDSREVFAKMPERNIISWNAIISGCAQHGNGKEAIQLFERMKATGMQPDHITFVGVLSACSHVGLLEEGSKYFDSISRDYGIMPRMEHYSCVVDLLSRAGHLDQAEAFIHTMPVKPSGLVWRTLLSACRVHDNMEIGRRAAECLLELEPLDATSYVLLSSIFAAGGRWNDAAKMRKIMNERGVKKEPGCSWIEVNKRVHAFITEDRSQELADDTYANLQKVSIMIENAGHLPGTRFMLYDIEQEQKEHNHFQQSLAIDI